MIDFSYILRLWSLNETFLRSRAIQVSKTHMDILCIKTCMFTTHIKCHFYYCELYFVKICD
jgi:hypothetical protein